MVIVDVILNILMNILYFVNIILLLHHYYVYREVLEFYSEKAYQVTVPVMLSPPIELEVEYLEFITIYCLVISIISTFIKSVSDSTRPVGVVLKDGLKVIVRSLFGEELVTVSL